MLTTLVLAAAVVTATPSEKAPPAEIRALQAASERAQQALFSISGKVVVIQHKRGFIVVSVLEQCSVEHRCYGGATDYVYDSKADKIVYVLGHQ